MKGEGKQREKKKIWERKRNVNDNEEVRVG